MTTYLASTVVGLLVYGFLELIISLLYSSSLFASQAMMETSLKLFTNGTNVVRAITSLLPFENSGISLSGFRAIVFALSDAVLLITILLSCYKYIASGFTGDKNDSPLHSLARCVIAKFLIIIFLGSGFNNRSLIDEIGRVFGEIIKYYFGTEILDVSSVTMPITLSQGTYITILALSVALFSLTLGNVVLYVERLISFALFVLFGPLALAFYASKDSEDIAKGWIKGIFSQLAVLFISLMLWVLAIKQIDGLQKIAVGKENALELVWQQLILIGLLSVMMNSEKLLNMLNVKTMVNRQSAQAVAGAVGTILHMASSAGTRLLREGTNASVKSKVVATGKGMTNFSNRNMLDNNGSIKSSFFSKSSITDGKQYNSSEGMKILSQVSAKNIGDIITSDNSKGIANTGRLVNATISKDLNKAGYNGFRYADTTTMNVASANNDGSSVKGIVGQGYIETNGKQMKNGQYFMPTNYEDFAEGGYKRDLVAGTKVDMGDNLDHYIGNNSYSIDESGTKVYEITTARIKENGNNQQTYCSKDSSEDNYISKETKKEVVKGKFNKPRYDSSLIEHL